MFRADEKQRFLCTTCQKAVGCQQEEQAKREIAGRRSLNPGNQRKEDKREFDTASVLDVDDESELSVQSASSLFSFPFLLQCGDKLDVFFSGLRKTHLLLIDKTLPDFSGLITELWINFVLWVANAVKSVADFIHGKAPVCSRENLKPLKESSFMQGSTLPRRSLINS